MKKTKNKPSKTRAQQFKEFGDFLNEKMDQIKSLNQRNADEVFDRFDIHFDLLEYNTDDENFLDGIKIDIKLLISDLEEDEEAEAAWKKIKETDKIFL